jgi:hypothetical protein
VSRGEFPRQRIHRLLDLFAGHHCNRILPAWRLPSWNDTPQTSLIGRYDKDAEICLCEH